MRRSARVDENQSAIVAALRKAGAMVQSLAEVGSGCPDLLVIRGGIVHLIEVKNPAKPPSQRRLTADQQAWHAVAGSVGYRVPVVETAEQAIEVIESGQRVRADPAGFEA